MLGAQHLEPVYPHVHVFFSKTFDIFITDVCYEETEGACFFPVHRKGAHNLFLIRTLTYRYCLMYSIAFSDE